AKAAPAKALTASMAAAEARAPPVRVIFMGCFLFLGVLPCRRSPIRPQGPEVTAKVDQPSL
ncbi:MAG: hypothetical protein QME55_00765, partial [Brevundimonas sp.]|uniref:hypothetical protein n=1 Tax=Brevundimonas sp. TaxID=1871086 RepID=UPI002614DA11